MLAILVKFDCIFKNLCAFGQYNFPDPECKTHFCLLQTKLQQKYFIAAYAKYIAEKFYCCLCERNTEKKKAFTS